MRILILADSPTLTSGFANTIRRVGKIFHGMGVEVQQIAFGLNTPVEYEYPLHPVPQNDFGRSIFPEVVERFLPNVVLSFADLHNIGWMSHYKSKFFQHWAYFPVDADRLTKTQIAILNSCVDLPIVYSRSALYAVTLDTDRLDTRLIYHGVEPDVFKPVSSKEDLKSQYGLRNKFVVGSVGRNNARKNFPSLIKGFAEFAKDKKDVVLYLHTNPKDYAGHNLYEFIADCGISDKVVITKDLDSTQGVTVDDLVKVYNLFDLHVLTTSGEGLCLPMLESQLCEIPTLVTDYSAVQEFVPKAMRIPVKAYYHEGFLWNIKRAIIDEDVLVQKLNTYYYNRNILGYVGKQGRQYVQLWDWKYIEPLWKYLVIQNGGKDTGVLSQFIKI